jgi:hypothetical protein
LIADSLGWVPQLPYSKWYPDRNSDSRKGPQHADRHWEAGKEVTDMPAKKAKPKAPAKKASKSASKTKGSAKKRTGRH